MAACIRHAYHDHVLCFEGANVRVGEGLLADKALPSAVLREQSFADGDMLRV